MNRFLAARALAALLLAAPIVAAGQQDKAAQGAVAAARKGDAQAQYRVGEMYDLGQGLPQDYREAVTWYRRAAEQGYARAQFALAEMYKNGDGVAKDIAQAARWYRRAADQGYADAQLLLGVLYESGAGVPADFEEAAKWYRRAADQGDARAQMLLGNLYQLGQGVAKSAIVAYALYTVSNGIDPKGNPSAGHRAQLARDMGGDDVAAATRLAAEMTKPGNFAPALDRYLRSDAKR